SAVPARSCWAAATTNPIHNRNAPGPLRRKEHHDDTPCDTVPEVAQWRERRAQTGALLVRSRPAQHPLPPLLEDEVTPHHREEPCDGPVQQQVDFLPTAEARGLRARRTMNR